MKCYLPALFIVCMCWMEAVWGETKTVNFEISVSRDSELGKEVIKIYEGIFQKYGYKFTALDYPPMRGVEELKKGNVDGTVGRTGNLADLFGLRNYVRLNEPLMFLTFSLWCSKSKEDMAHMESIQVGYYRGSIASTRIIGKVDSKKVNPIVLNNYKIAISMLKKGRLDCMVGSEAIIDSEGNSLDDMERFYRHNIVTSAVYPWISQQLIHLKDKIEKDLANQAFSDQWERKYRFERASCRKEYDWLCPDGLVFQTAVDMSQ